MGDFFRRCYRYARRNPLPLWAGFAVIGGIQLKHLYQERQRQQIGNQGLKDTYTISLYKCLPLRGLSRLWGRLNDLDLPVWSRPLILGTYAKIFKCNLEECEIQDLREYANLGTFFRRRLVPSARVIDPDPKGLTSPCDGKVLHAGPIRQEDIIDGHIIRVKGISYSLDTFLGVDTVAPVKTPATQLYQCVIYLAPGDYHGFHSPTDFEIKVRRHFSGKLLSVSPSVVKRLHNLFAINERVVYKGYWAAQRPLDVEEQTSKKLFFSYSAVGATNVGSIRVAGDPDLKTNCKSDPDGCCATKNFETLMVHKGDYIGEFNLGSTIVLVFEGPENLRFCVKEEQAVKMGEKVAFWQ